MAFKDKIGVPDMVLLDNCDHKKLIENLKKRWQKNIIYVRFINYLLLKFLKNYNYN